MTLPKLDRRIELQSFAATDPWDVTSGTWTTQATVKAKRMERSQAERFVTDTDIATASRFYRIRWPDSGSMPDPTWRVKDGTELWDIEGVAEGEGRSHEMILLCTRHDPGDDSA